MRRGSEVLLPFEARSSFMFECRELLMSPTTGRLSPGPCSARSITRSSIASGWSLVKVSHHLPNSSVNSTSHTSGSISSTY